MVEKETSMQMQTNNKQKFDEKIEEKAIELSNIDLDIENLENLLSAKKDEYNLKTQELAEMMETEGYTSGTKIILKNGRQLKVKEFFNAGIPSMTTINKEKDPSLQRELAEKRIECFEWLNENGLNAIVKNKLVAHFEKGEQEKVKAIQEFCKQQNIESETEESVHPSTLKGSLKEAMQAGQKVPFDLFDVTTGITVEIK